MKVPFLTIIFLSSVVLFMIALARAIALNAAKMLNHMNMNHHLCRLFPDYPRFPNYPRCNDEVINIDKQEEIEGVRLSLLFNSMTVVQICIHFVHEMLSIINHLHILKTIALSVEGLLAGKQLFDNDNGSSQNEEDIPLNYANSLDNNKIQNGSSLDVISKIIVTEQGRITDLNQALRGKIKLA